MGSRSILDLTDKNAALTGIELEPTKSLRSPVSDQFFWLRIVSELPRMNLSTTGYETDNPCPSCGRAGHYHSGNASEVPAYEDIPTTARDFNATWEYFGNWQQVRSPAHKQPVGGSRGVIISKRARRIFQKLRVSRMVWIPVISATGPMERALSPNTCSSGQWLRR